LYTSPFKTKQSEPATALPDRQQLGLGLVRHKDVCKSPQLGQEGWTGQPAVAQ